MVIVPSSLSTISAGSSAVMSSGVIPPPPPAPETGNGFSALTVTISPSGPRKRTSAMLPPFDRAAGGNGPRPAPSRRVVRLPLGGFLRGSLVADHSLGPDHDAAVHVQAANPVSDGVVRAHRF